MASPLAIGSLGLSVVGAGISAFGANKTAQANSDAAIYQSQVAANNKKIADQNAAYAITSGRSQAFANDLKTDQTLGTQKAVQAANGLDVNSGTNVNVRQSTEEMGRLDTLTIMNNAMKQAGGFLAQGANFQAESDLDKMKAKTSETTGDIGVATSLLGGASSFGDKWLNYSQKGVKGF